MERGYWSIPNGVLTEHTRRSDIENCEGWLSPGGHSSGGRALTAKVRGPQFNPEWLPVLHSSLNIFPSLFIMSMQVSPTVLRCIFFKAAEIIGSLNH